MITNLPVYPCGLTFKQFKIKILRILNKNSRAFSSRWLDCKRPVFYSLGMLHTLHRTWRRIASGLHLGCKILSYAVRPLAHLKLVLSACTGSSCRHGSVTSDTQDLEGDMRIKTNINLHKKCVHSTELFCFLVSLNLPSFILVKSSCG